MITGRYSGRQPAITALTAIFSIVHGAHFGGIGPITSCGSRAIAPSIFSTRAAVGGTMGKPSLSFSFKNQSLTASQLSSTSIRFEVRFIVRVTPKNLPSVVWSTQLFASTPSPLRGRTEEGGAFQIV